MKYVALFLLLAISAAACKQSSTTRNTSGKTPLTDSLVNNSADLVDSEYRRGADLIAKYDCLTCHKLNEQSFGPSYMDVAKKYSNVSGNVNNLAHKIISGAQGAWGNKAMTPHPNITVPDAEEMVRYILSLKPKA
jgi:cytochrome c